ncbi:MAG: phosphotransferase [Acidobacteriota bacterium]
MNEASIVAKSFFSINAQEVAPLEGYYDQNFRIDSEKGRFVLKIWNLHQKTEFLDLQEKVMNTLSMAEIRCPRLLETAQGGTSARLSIEGQPPYLAQMLTWVEGVQWSEAASQGPEAFFKLGGFLARLTQVLMPISHPAALREFKWDLRFTGQSRPHLGAVASTRRRRIATHFLDSFESRVKTKLDDLDRSLIHNDVNAFNVFLDESATNPLGIIDFANLVRSATVGELAVGTAYGILDQPDPLRSAASIVRGYSAIRPIGEREVDLLYDLIALRLVASVLNSAHEQKLDPDNQYLHKCEEPGWTVLEKWIDIRPARALELFRES